MRFGNEKDLLDHTEDNPKPFHLRVMIIKEVKDDRCCEEIDTYLSLAEAINDARSLYLLHNDGSTNHEIDFRIFDNIGTLVYSVAKDNKIAKFIK